MKKFQDNIAGNLVKNIGCIFIFFFLLQLIVGSVLIYQVAIKQTTEYLQHTTQRVREDITYRNDTWDIHKYNADPNVPDTYPLYVLSSDGFVIDRWKPVRGFLDTSDSKHLLNYKTPQTITTPTRQTWRMVSRPIIHNDEIIGVITVAYFNPKQDALTEIDARLQNSLDIIASRISTKNNAIALNTLDVRDISFDISFQVADSFNRIITKSNNTNSIDRIPNFIDTSYIGDLINGSRVRQVRDTVTQEKFLLLSSPIVDEHNTIVGMIIAGKSIAYIDEVLRNFLIAEGCFGFVLIITFLSAIHRIIMSEIKKMKLNVPEPIKRDIDHVSFDKKTGTIILDAIDIHIPYATNQYYLCEALFSAPRKHWEIDELLERFGEQDWSNWRKVYDAMLIVNKKVSLHLDAKLIIAREKTYQINPLLLSKLV